MATSVPSLIDIPTQVQEEFARTYGVRGPDSYTLIDAAGFVQVGHSEFDVLRAAMLRNPVYRQGTFPFYFFAPAVFFYRKPLSYEEIGEEMSRFTPIVPAISHSGLGQVLLRVRELCNPREQSGDTPTAFACSTASQLLNDANSIAPIVLEPAIVEASDGDLLIHWDAPMKGVVLICPREGPPSLYRETLDGARPTSSELFRDVSASSLSEALAWVQSPAR